MKQKHQPTASVASTPLQPVRCTEGGNGAISGAWFPRVLQKLGLGLSFGCVRIAYLGARGLATTDIAVAAFPKHPSRRR